MLFTSIKFIVFTAILFAVYHLAPQKMRWSLLLIASGIYVVLSDDTRWVFLTCMAVTAITSWAAALWMDKIGSESDAYIKSHKEELDKAAKKALKEKTKSKKKLIMALCLLLNLGILAVTKYTDFVIENINAVLKSEVIRPSELIVPLGISFYTFRTVSYVIDVYRGTSKAEKNPFKVALFVSFFPQIAQGPISRWNKLSETLFEGRRLTGSEFGSGFIRILWGYFKKVVVADRLVKAVLTIVGDPAQYQGIFVFAAMLFYAFELYCDFTGGIDITIGIGECLGVKMEENFNLPYFSKSIKEYWNRWHITMGQWFTDYIFYPLSISPKMLELSKKSRKKLGNVIGKRISVYIACFLVWLATGIWHGPAWNFIVWGLLNFVVIMVSQELEPLYAKFHSKFGLKKHKWYGVFEIVRTFFLMGMIRMLDCYRDVPLTFKMLGTMFTGFKVRRITDGSFLELGMSVKEYILVAVCLVVIFLVSLYKAVTKKDIREKLVSNMPLGFAVCVILIIVTLLFGAYGHGFDTKQFIYTQF